MNMGTITQLQRLWRNQWFLITPQTIIEKITPGKIPSRKFPLETPSLEKSPLYKIPCRQISTQKNSPPPAPVLGKSPRKIPPLRKFSLIKLPPREFPLLPIAFHNVFHYVSLSTSLMISSFSSLHVQRCNLDTRGRWNLMQN